PAFSQMTAEQVDTIVQAMLEQSILWEEQGILGIGRAGEDDYGRRHFMELLSVFMTPPLFKVLHGRQEIGFVDELTFLGKKEGVRVLLLGGRPWNVTHIDWARKVAFVEASENRGRSRWKGEGRGLSFRLCQAIKTILISDEIRSCWSIRTQEQLNKIRQEYAWLSSDCTTVHVAANNEATWFTFAGIGANTSLASALTQATQTKVSAESFGVTFEPQFTEDRIESAIQALKERNVAELLPAIDERAIESLKFSECLPRELVIEILQRRLHDSIGLAHAMSFPVRFVRG
ncbi:MAG: ATP-dependent helicase, partial [Planctomycetota bacterium]